MSSQNEKTNVTALVRKNLTLDKAEIERAESLAPDGNVSAYVRRAIEEKNKRERRRIAKATTK